jgi:hypothetical protein
MEEFEKLRETYQRYLPPSNLWDKIETDLEYESLIKPLIKNLPEYQAPEEIWMHIEKSLPPNKKVLFKYSKFAKQASAAIILLAIGFGLGRWMEVKSEISEIKHTPSAASRFKSDQADMKRVVLQYSQLCKHYPEELPCSLVVDLSDLESAKQELETIIIKMGNSDHLVKQLRRIELEKNRIIRNMAQRI